MLFVNSKIYTYQHKYTLPIICMDYVLRLPVKQWVFMKQIYFLLYTYLPSNILYKLEIVLDK